MLWWCPSHTQARFFLSSISLVCSTFFAFFAWMSTLFFCFLFRCSVLPFFEFSSLFLRKCSSYFCLEDAYHVEHDHGQDHDHVGGQSKCIHQSATINQIKEKMDVLGSISYILYLRGLSTWMLAKQRDVIYFCQAQCFGRFLNDDIDLLHHHRPSTFFSRTREKYLTRSDNHAITAQSASSCRSWRLKCFNISHGNIIYPLMISFPAKCMYYIYIHCLILFLFLFLFFSVKFFFVSVCCFFLCCRVYFFF